MRRSLRPKHRKPSSFWMITYEGQWESCGVKHTTSMTGFIAQHPAVWIAKVNECCFTRNKLYTLLFAMQIDAKTYYDALDVFYRLELNGGLEDEATWEHTYGKRK